MLTFADIIDRKFMFNLILFGPPGSGKGTQSENIVRAYQLHHISTGDLLREEVAQETPLGREARKYMDKGMLVPDEVVIGMISSAIDENPDARGFIFDGFPRTKEQAEALDKLLDLKRTEIHLVLSLEVPEEDLIQRLLGRAEVSGRTDDNQQVIHDRIKEYHSKSVPVDSHYVALGKLDRVPGAGTIDETFALLSRKIDKYFQPV